MRSFAKCVLPMLSLASILAGCASFPDSVDTLPTPIGVSTELETKWASLPAVQHVSADTGKSVRRRMPLPLAVAEKHLNFALSGKTTVGELSLEDGIAVEHPPSHSADCNDQNQAQQNNRTTRWCWARWWRW